MKTMLKSNLLTFVTLGAGAAAAVLRWLLYALTVDEKNLLPVLHPLEIGLWVLTLAAAAFVIARVRILDGSNRYVDNFSPSLLSMLGAFVMAAGIVITVLTVEPTFEGPVSLLWKITGFLSAPALAAVGFSRKVGKRPLFLCHFVVCVYFVLHMVNRYQSWSGNPQLQDYFYSLGGSILLILFAFYQTAFDVGSGKRRMQLATGLLAAFFCMAALPQAQTGALYLTGAVWTLTNLCTQTPVPRKKPQSAPEPIKE